MKQKILLALTSVWLIAIVAFAARAGFLWDQQSKIPHQVLATVPFDQEAGNIALALHEGRGFGDVFRKPTGPTAWLAPVYPFLLADLFRIFGSLTFHAFLAAALLNCVFSAAVSFPVYYAAQRIAGTMAATVAGWLWAIFPQGVMMSSEWIWDTSLSAFFAAVLLWAAVHLREKGKSGDWCAYGALWGIALLTNPSLVILLPCFVAWAARGSPSKTLGFWRKSALAVGIAVLCCLPWTIRNQAVFHHFIPLRSNFAFELWLGNNDIFDEHSVGGIQRITRFGEVRLYSQLGETAFMQEKFRLAWNFIRTHPAVEARLTARRVLATWMGTETPLRDFLGTDSWLIRAIFISNSVVMLGTIAGIFLLLRRRSAVTVPLASVPLLFPLVYYMTHTSLRYRHPADPVLLMLTAIAVRALIPRRSELFTE
jgi:4-amino-4-deoxy-L-arabinose transferase-like glycosyltransferase